MDDCGLFALAFCETWCRLEDVEDLSIDQGKMREHLEKCLRSRDQQLTAFPLLQRTHEVKASDARLLVAKDIATEKNSAGGDVWTSYVI